MSRGLGSFQRQIIEAGGATKTIWEIGEPIPCYAQTTTPRQINGGEVHAWGMGNPWFVLRFPVYSREEFEEYHRELGCSVSIRSETAEPFLPALWSMNSLRTMLFPHLYDPACSIVVGSRAAKNCAKVRMSKSITSLRSRGIIRWAGSATMLRSYDAPWNDSLKNRWPNHYAGSWNVEHSLLAVLTDEGKSKR